MDDYQKSVIRNSLTERLVKVNRAIESLKDELKYNDDDVVELLAEYRREKEVIEELRNQFWVSSTIEHCLIAVLYMVGIPLPAPGIRGEVEGERKWTK